jgi:hypothetical protein
LPYKQTPGGSYSKDCDFCGRRIQLRKMGPGHYVAFEGNNVHECQHPPANKYPMWTWSDSGSPTPPPPKTPQTLPPLRSDFQIGSMTQPPPERQPLTAPPPPDTPTPRTPTSTVALLSPLYEQRFDHFAGDENDPAAPLRSDFTLSRPERRVRARENTSGPPVQAPAAPTRGGIGPDFHKRAAYSFEPASPRSPSAPRGGISWKWLAASAVVAILIGGCFVAAAARGGVTDPVAGGCPPGFPVKGNISATREHIYHVPGGAFYAATRPEKCFRDAAAAEAGGFRRSVR